MKTKFLLLFLLWAGSVCGQDEVQDIQRTLLSDENRISDDIYNPINFTTITERMPQSNKYPKKYTHSEWSSLDYFKIGSNVHIEFDKKFIDALGRDCDIQIIAFIQRKDKTVKPLTVNGFTQVEATSDKVDILKQNSIILKNEKGLNQNEEVGYKYVIRNTKKDNVPSYSGEINLSDETISEEDRIVIQINNIARSYTGFSMTLIADDFGWKQGPTGGFSFVKIAESGFREFSPSASLGYSFRYQPRKSSRFTNHFFSPAFGPMLHVFQNGNDTTIGAGLFLSSFYNMVNIGGGWTINGVNHGKPYIAIGLNFIESYNTITNLLK